MSRLLHDLIAGRARTAPATPALTRGATTLDYGTLWQQVTGVARGLAAQGLIKGDRVAIYLEKNIPCVVAMFGTTAGGGVLVPINPHLKAPQVLHILADSGARILITTTARLGTIAAQLCEATALQHVILTDAAASEDTPASAIPTQPWDALNHPSTTEGAPVRGIDADLAAILYTSGSTGRPKGVVLSHRNIVAGAESVSSYLENDARDRILSVLPFSFDAGFSQITTAFCAGAELVLLDFLIARDVARACAKHRITGLTGVPTLWHQLARLDWPAEATPHLRYFANTGGHMPRDLLQRLRAVFPKAKPFLMYGLTEAFRSTYLDPAEVDRRPNSIGKAIPNAEILVVRPDGTPCVPGEKGELVHRGALVAQGYWNDPERTAERFRPAPGQPAQRPLTEIAVWSGDIVYADEKGFLYFVGRRDEMIKTSGYRVSPTEVEEAVLASGLVGEAVAFGAPHAELGQGIVVVATAKDGAALDTDALLVECRTRLPGYMVPGVIVARETLPRTPNGKIDRSGLAVSHQTAFEAAPAKAANG